ncbi:MAG: hypothetical protein CBC72_002370 [Gammaproteobacteria bacterium TMED112]|nr:MAG: hypothetical protein CBC72_002370 [Gammaproteobacteria bacterium TMED112]|tara:strand:+ start:2826 stop:3632 length:807 start_codon:yes stop_codon:yes gene_type:complete
MFRLIFIAILFGLVYVLWDTSKVTEAVTDLSNTTNEVIGSTNNSNTTSQSTDNALNDDTDALNQSVNNRTRAIREDPVAYVNNSLVKLNEGKKRLEDRLFEQKVLITQLERRKDTDQKTLDRHETNLSTWKNAYQNKEFNTEAVPFNEKQIIQLLKDTYKRKLALEARPEKYDTFLLNGKGFVIELENHIEKLDDQILTLEMDKGMLEVLSTTEGFYEVRDMVDSILDTTNTLANYGDELNVDAAANVQAEATSSASDSLEDILNNID